MGSLASVVVTSESLVVVFSDEIEEGSDVFAYVVFVVIDVVPFVGIGVVPVVVVFVVDVVAFVDATLKIIFSYFERCSRNIGFSLLIVASGPSVVCSDVSSVLVGLGVVVTKSKSDNNVMLCE